MTGVGSERTAEIAARVEAFVRDVVAGYERDPRCGSHGPSDDLVAELRDLARQAGVLTPHILADRSEQHTSELQALMRLPYADFCLKEITDTKASQTSTIM